MSTTGFRNEAREITPEEIQLAITRARRMRSETFALYFRRLGGWVRESLGAATERQTRPSPRFLQQSH